MLTLLSEYHLWSIRDDIRIKATDYGAFRYARIRDFDQDDIAARAKREYTEHRNGTAVLKNNRRGSRHRLKDNIKKLEELLRTQRLVHSHWHDGTAVLLLFASGVIAHICIDMYTGDILRMVFEKYFVGKLAAEYISDAFFTRSHIVLAYNTNQLTVVYLQRPNTRPQGLEKICKMDPRIFHVLIPGPSDRKLLRNLVVNSSFDLFVIWTKSSQNEVYPWRPTIRDQDRANINIFKLKGLQLESVSYCWTENDPVYVNFLRSTEFQILTVEQKILRKGEICAEICSYDINLGKMQRSVLALIPIGTQISCIAFSPDKEKLFMGTTGRYICLHDLVQQDTKVVAQIDIIPSQCSWHSDSSIIMIANDRSQFQCFDLALCPVANHLQSDHVTSSILFDLSQYFGSQSKLLKIAFSRKPDMETLSQCYAQTDSFLLLYFENGPLGCLRFFSTSGMRGDIHNSGLTVDVIVDKYLLLNQLEKAVNLFVALNWETYGAMCLISLHKIANFVFFQGELNRSCVGLMVKAFKTFSNSLSEETKDEFSDQVFDLKRRFFFFLLRNNIYADAFEIADDIEDYDLFMDLFNSTKSKSKFENYSAAALNRAVVILHEEEFGNGIPNKISECNSESTFSQSSYCGTMVEVKHMYQLQKEKSQNRFKNYVPPLPSLKSKIVKSEMKKINIPKPDLHHNLPTVKSSYIIQQQDIVVPTNNDNNSQSKTTHLTGYSKTNVGLSWQMDTAKVPAISNATIAQHILSRTSITASKLSPSFPKTNQQLLQKNSTPSIINLPADFTTRAFSQYRPIFFQHPLVSGNIPSTSISTVAGLHLDYQKSSQRKPSGSILSNSSTTQNATVVNGHNTLGTHPTTVSKDFIGRTAVVEKNKVKFSDTVQVAVVPEIQRKEKSVIPKRNGYSRPTLRNITNPKKELADSLPLCHPNDDYLKDFNPISSEELLIPLKEREDPSTSKKKSPPSSIKVVHFGVV